MNSGVQVTDEIREAFERVNKRISALILVKIENSKMILEKEVSKKEFEWEKMPEYFPDNKACFACMELNKAKEDGSMAFKLVAFTWTPVTASPLSKMTTSTSFKGFVSEFSQISKDFQLDEKDQLTKEKLLEKI